VSSKRHASPGKRGKRRLLGPPWVGACTLALFAGMLIWSKLRIASSVPRSAFADPASTDTGEDQAADRQDPSDSTPVPSRDDAMEPGTPESP
jgi:hypothetical protein